MKKENVVCKQNCFFQANGQINLSKVHYTQENDPVLGFVDFNQIKFQYVMMLVNHALYALLSIEKILSSWSQLFKRWIELSTR